MSVPSQKLDPMKYLEIITSRDTVQILTAGSSGEEVYEKSGHGLFTYFFLKGLRGEADLDGDGRITAGELRDFVSDGVRYRAGRFLDGPWAFRCSERI